MLLELVEIIAKPYCGQGSKLTSLLLSSTRIKEWFHLKKVDHHFPIYEPLPNQIQRLDPQENHKSDPFQ